MDTFQCETYCCSESTIPLIVYKEITVQKSKGVSIGIRKSWYTVFVTITGKHTWTQTGTELVALSRANKRNKLPNGMMIPMMSLLKT